MKWSFKIGRFLGIDVFIHHTFLMLMALIGAMHWMVERTPAAAVEGMLFFGLIFVCVLLHEYGHALMARKYGIGTRDITLLPFGGVASLEKMPAKPIQELWVALAGPAVNVVIAIGLALWLSVSNTWQPISELGTTSGGMAERLLAVNIFLVMFNMLPAFPMDGGRVLRALLAMRMEYTRATSIAATTGKCMAALFAVAGLFGNPMLLIIAIFVWMGATQESAAVHMRASLAGARVGDAMITNFVSLPPDASLGDVSRLMLDGSQNDFPIVENERIIGILSRDSFFEAIKSRPSETPLHEVMRGDFTRLEEGEMLDEVLADVGPEAGLSIPVLRRGRLVGLLTAENLHELYLLRSADAARNGYSRHTFRFPINPTLKPHNVTTR